MTDSPRTVTPLTTCDFVPPHEPWTCRVHQGVRTSLDEPQCDIARPAEPFNDAYLDNIRQAIAEGRNPASRYIVRRLLATLDAVRSTPDPAGAGLREARHHIEVMFTDEIKRGAPTSKLVVESLSRRVLRLIDEVLAQSSDGSLDATWEEAEAALPQKNADGLYPPDGRYIVLHGPIASGVYRADAVLFDGNKAERERLERKTPTGFAPVGTGPAAALRALAARLTEHSDAGEAR